MGNENSILEECKLDTDVAVIKDWRLCNGTWSKINNSKYLHDNNTKNVTLFEKKVSQHSSKRDVEFHDNAAKCLKIFRHPCIVRYYDSGHRGDNMFLITELVTPLSKKLTQFSPLEICAGLHSILQALVFFHDVCKVRHNSFDIESVFVAQDGTWKLSGMEFVCHQADFNEAFLQKNRAFRKEALIPPEEKEGQFTHLSTHGYASDVYDFGLFSKELLEIILKLGGLPGTKEFLDQIKKEVLISDPRMRPQMKLFLNNIFFKNDFIEIHTFLQHLAAKLDKEKEEFFRTIAPKLFRLPEKIIATRLAELLLSRFVLLDSFAKEFLLPHFLRPSRDHSRRTEFIEDEVNPILSVSLYQEYVIPQLSYIFEVRDIDIRIVLLTYFEHYVDLFSEDVLIKKILPQILLGVKDVNNTLVAISLRALASLVPLLGGEVVVGGKRNQYFTEAKPKEQPLKQDDKADNTTTFSDIIDTITLPNLLNNHQLSAFTINNQNGRICDQTISPDTIQQPVLDVIQSNVNDSNSCEVHSEREDEVWSDWEGPQDNNEISDLYDKSAIHNLKNNVCEDYSNKDLKMQESGALVGLGEEFDVMAVEIKSCTNEINFFEGMQPVISNCSFSSTLIANQKSHIRTSDTNSNNAELLFAVDETKQDDPNGWDDMLNLEEDL